MELITDHPGTTPELCYTPEGVVLTVGGAVDVFGCSDCGWLCRGVGSCCGSPPRLTLDGDSLTVDEVGMVDGLAVIAVAVPFGQTLDLEVCVVLVDRGCVQRLLLS